MRPLSGIPSVWRAWLPAGLLAAAVLLAYGNSLRGPFVFDDTSSIPANPTIRHLWPPWAPLATPKAGGVTVTGRPLLNLSFAVDYAFAGNAVWIYHLTNLVIHILAVLTLYGIIRRTLSAPRLERVRTRTDAENLALAWGVALVWGLHPLQTEAVTYIVQRAESLMGLFYLLTLYAFIRSVDRPGPAAGLESRAPRSAKPPNLWRWQAAAILACAAGMGTKEVMVSAPWVILLYDRIFIAGSFGAALKIRGPFYCGLAATWIFLGFLIVSAGGNRGGSIGFGVGVGWWEHAWTQFPALARYLGLSIWPHPLVFEYEPQWVHFGAVPVLSGLLVALLFLGTLVAIIRGSPLGFLGAWFFAILAPTSLMPAPSQFVVEHRMYLALAAVLVLLGLALRAFLGRIGVILLVLGGLACGVLTAVRNHDYRSELSLWTDTVVKRPDNALAREMLAEAWDHAGRPADAIAEHVRAIELRPNLAIAHLLLADDLNRVERSDEAIAEYEAALRYKPDSVDAHNNLGAALSRAGRRSEAIPHFQAAVRIMPEFADAHYNLANALEADGQKEAAVAEYEQALRLRPDYFEAHFNLATTLASAGRQLEALVEYQAALQLRPASSRAHYNLGNAFAALGRMPEAAAQYQTTVRLEPNFADAHSNLASAFLVQGRKAEAIAEYEAALRLDPNAADVQQTLFRLRNSNPNE